MAAVAAAAVSASALLGLLAGPWRLCRTITGSQSGRLEGEAVFTADGADALTLQEAGTLTLPDGLALTSSRRWRWRATRGGLIAIDFADGAAAGGGFITLGPARPPGSWIALGPHRCGADRYAVTWRLAPCGSRCESEVIVDGPRKAYRVSSRLWRGA